jgi:hypothetical protein
MGGDDSGEEVDSRQSTVEKEKGSGRKDSGGPKVGTDRRRISYGVRILEESSGAIARKCLRFQV